jgi:PKD repeat protein
MAGQQTLTAPATVVFTDASIGEALTYSWKFGDGSDAASINPTHTYQNPGTYTVELTVTSGDDLSNTATADLVVYQQSSGNGNGNGNNGRDDLDPE